MSPPRPWITARMIEVGLTQRQLGERAHMTQQNVSKIVRGINKLNDDLAKRLAGPLQWEPAQVYGPEWGPRARIVGTVGDTEAVDLNRSGEEFVRIQDPPPGVSNLRAAIVQTDALSPRFRRGDYILFGDSVSEPLGECVACREDGTVTVTTIEPGTSPETYTLRPYGPHPRVDVNQRLQWAAPIIGVWLARS